MSPAACREHRVRSTLFPNHFLREYQHSPTNSFQKAFCPFRESCFPKTCSNPVAAAVYKNKLTVNRRRYLARVLSSLTYRYVCFRTKCAKAHRDVSVSYMQSGLRRQVCLTNFQFKKLLANLTSSPYFA